VVVGLFGPNESRADKSAPARPAVFSGYQVADPSTRAIQDDDFANPAFLWIESARQDWQQPVGKAQKSCADCHGAVESLRGAATHYPTTDATSGQFFNLEGRINDCRRRMGAEAYAYESDALLGLTALVRLQSRGLPMAVEITGANAGWFAAGQAYYEQPRGQLDLSCADCHRDNVGQMLRSEVLSQGQSNGFPTYRLKWQSLGSLHRRFRGCNENIRAEPLAAGSDAYLALELYLAWRGQDLVIETPSVRK
jgi:sulfur-oxidizing protein SoxA